MPSARSRRRPLLWLAPRMSAWPICCRPGGPVDGHQSQCGNEPEDEGEEQERGDRLHGPADDGEGHGKEEAEHGEADQGRPVCQMAVREAEGLGEGDDVGETVELIGGEIDNRELRLRHLGTLEHVARADGPLGNNAAEGLLPG